MQARRAPFPTFHKLPQHCRPYVHRRAVKYFSSQKCWMRTSVLACFCFCFFVVFFSSHSDRQTLFSNILRKALLSCLPANISVSATEVTSCFLDKAQAPQLAHHHSYVISGQQTKLTHGQKSTPLTHTFHLTSCLAQRPKILVGISIFGINLLETLFYAALNPSVWVMGKLRTAECAIRKFIVIRRDL